MGIFNIFSKKKTQQDSTPSLESLTFEFTHFQKVVDYLYTKSGITDLDKRALSISALQRFAEENRVQNTDEFLQKMKIDKDFYQSVLNIITVNETFFFREINELEWLISYIKDTTTPQLKILSLPCSTGEEVYSILILLDKNKINLDKIELIGYDINSDVLHNAKEAIYNEHSLHKVDEMTKQKYFVKLDNNTYKVIPSLTQKVKFYQKNIFELEEENLFDVVLSRNMFIYFDEKKREEATNIIVNLIKDGGCFIKGHADAIAQHPHLVNEHYGIYCVKKN